ncbi:MAG: ACT domain-containing protein, partial [Chthoniobacter sp.]|nr:ACT domain-containing protein [Chthoniobacter sp.]
MTQRADFTRPDFVLLVSCQDRKGLVAAIAGSIAAQDCNIAHSAQFDDAHNGRFFMRVAFKGPEGLTREKFGEAFLSVAAAYNLDWSVHDLRVKQRAMIMVSKGGHCLNDLLYRTATRYLPMEVTSVVSNHTTWQRRVEHE